MIKNAIKIICFFAIFMMLFNYTFKILWLKKNSIAYYYEEPKETIDITFVGPSSVYVDFNPTLAFNLYGYTTGLLSDGSQPIASTKYLIKDAQKYQNSKLYIVDLAISMHNLLGFTPEDMRRTLDSMNFSFNRIDAINHVLRYTHMRKSNYLNYYFSFFQYHGAWKNITKQNFSERTNLYKGYLFSGKKVYPREDFKWNKEVRLWVPKPNEEIIIDLVQYLKQENINVLFVISPTGYSRDDMGGLNVVKDMLKENGFEVINFYELEDFDIDFATDFFDERHLNVDGATKYTLYLSKYLKEHYDLPDHRNDPTYSSWNGEYNRFKENYKAIIGTEYDELLQKYSK